MIAGVSDADPYDAVLLLSFGGPDRPDDVMPFLLNVTRGRGIPPERLQQVAEHYLAFGGSSPINEQNSALLSALHTELEARGLRLPLYWGNRNWHPMLADTLHQMQRDGVRRAAVLVTSAYSGYSGCRQYREDLAAALAGLDPAGPTLVLDKVRHFFNHPGFVAALTAAVSRAWRQVDEADRGHARLVFVTHSVPTAANETSGPDGGAYLRQHDDVAATVAQALRADGAPAPSWDLVFCSRSGPPGQPWLEPDVNDHLRVLHAGGVRAVVLAPIGFVSDHMEVAYDLDTEAAATAAGLGIRLVRAATPGTAPEFVSGLVDLVLERAAAERARTGVGEPPPRPAAGRLGPSPDVCPSRCCPNPRAPLPAACGSD